MIKRALKWTKWLSMSLLVLVILLVLALAGALFTNPGLHVVLWGAQQALPQLKVEQAQGALFPRFTLQGVNYADSELNLSFSVQKLSLAINPNCLLEPSICINELALSGVKLDLPSLAESEPAPDEPDSEPLGDISTPIPIRLGQLALQDIELNILGNRVAWQQLTTRASWQGNRLRIGQTEWQGIRLALAESEASTEPEAAQAATSDSAEPLQLPDVMIPLHIELARFDIRDFRLEQETPIIVNHLALQATAAQHDVSISSLELSMPELDAQLNAQATLSQDYPIQLELRSQVHLADFKGQTLSLAAQGSLADLTVQANLDSLAQAQLNSHFNLLDADIPFDLQLSQVKAQWPMLGEGDYHVEVPELSIQGSLAKYQFALQGALQGKDLPNVSLALQGHGNLDEVALQSLKVDTLGGLVTGNAVANWKNPLNWAARLNLKNIQPGLQ